MMYYVLRGHTPVPEPDLEVWARWFKDADRTVKLTTVHGKGIVSTVFLGVDHSFADCCVELFETLVFGGLLDGKAERYATWNEAVEGHAQMVARVEAANPTYTTQLDIDFDGN